MGNPVFDLIEMPKPESMVDGRILVSQLALFLEEQPTSRA